MTVVLPDELIRQARAAGLLTGAELEKLLRRVLDQRAAGDRLGEVFSRIDALDEPPPADGEVAAEVAAARRDRLHRR